MKLRLYYMVVAVVGSLGWLLNDDVSCNHLDSGEICSFGNWLEFKKLYRKWYKDPSEDQVRMELYCENLIKVQRHNRRVGREHLAVNEMSDWTKEEFDRILMKPGEHEVIMKYLDSNNFMKSLTADELALMLNINDGAPGPINYRYDKRVVTPVKTQGDCGSCWAFAYTALMESMLHKWDPSIKEVVSLSEQQLVDCANKHGCLGGNANDAYSYLENVGGQMRGDDYPYQAKVGQCRPINVTMVEPATRKFNGYLRLEGQDEELMKKVVRFYGPIAVSIKVGDVFRYIRPGEVVKDDPYCGDRGWINHIVLLVGYDTSASGEDYWIIKNSWGTQHADGGYVMMARNANNSCSIASTPYVLY